MTLLMMLLTTMTAWAQLSNLTYNSAGGFYEIWSVADLQAMANYYNGFNGGSGGSGKVFKMMQDIDLAGVNTSFLPIAFADSENYFGDVFDGNNHAIKNLSLVREYGTSYYGLFHQLASTATVKDLTLKDCDVRYTGQTGGTSVGAIAGRNRGTIQNCTVIGTVSNHDNEHCVGAIVGENISPGRVENCNAVAGQPVTGVLYSTSTPGTESGNHLYFRLLTTSAVSLTTTPAATTVAGTACYAANTALALTVTPNDGTQMLTDVSFTGTTATKTAYGQYALTIPAGDVSVTAALAAKISVSATGGTVTPNTYSPAVGSQVTLTLAPNTGYALTAIAATAGGTALTLNGSGLTRTFTMPDKPVSITASFSAISYTVSGLGSTTGGRISGPGTAHYGDEVTLTATPAAGYSSLQTLTVTTAGNQNVALSGSGLTRTFTMPAENVTVSATFALTQLTVHVTAYNCTATATPNPATMGQTVTVSFTPDAGATLQSVTVRDAEWNYLTVSGSGLTRTFTMSATDAYVTVACSSSGQLAGKGTQDEPYLIFNEADLRLLSSLSKTTTFWGTDFRLERDITMSDTPMLPIGDSSNGQFEGHFDGNGHTISNLHISGKVADFVALFGINYGSVSNLTLASCAITGNESVTSYIGAIVGYNNGTVSNCHVNSGTISATAAEDVGGIVGFNHGGTISGCTNGATVSRTASTVQTDVGGIVGFNSTGTVKDCANTGSVSISGTVDGVMYHCGGIAGYLYSGILSGCANTGSVSATGSNAYNYAGGVAGTIADSDAAICIGNTNGGAVSAANGNRNFAGGIVGYYYYSSYILKNNYYFGACTAKGSADYVSSGDAPQSDVTANYGAVPGYAITKPAEVTLSSIEGYADVAHPAYAASGETVSFTVATVPEGYAATVKYNDGSDHTLTATNGVYSFTMPAKAVTITVSIAPDPAQFAQSGDTYTIKSAGGWNVFCDLLAADGGKAYFSGKTVKLVPTDNSNSITVTRMAGSDYHDFCGTFDGGGNTINLNLDSSNGAYALFRNVENGTIKNLHVTGTINASAKYAAGLISNIWGTVNINNCTSSVIITSSVSGDGTHGGLVAVVNTNSTLNITGCLFDGKLLTTNGTTDCGGFVGYGTCNITNSLYAPATIDQGETEVGASESATFARGTASGITITNCYYTKTLGEAQGTRAYTSRQSFPCKSATILGTTVYYAADLTPFGKTDSYTPDGTDSKPYIISTTEGWNYLCDALQDNDTWNRFSGKTVMLGEDIGTTQEPVTRWAGSGANPFCGNFNGGGNTLTFTATATDNYCAPFCNVQGGSTDAEVITISNLNVKTTITAPDYRHAAGLIALQSGHVNVSGCNVEVTISSTVGDNNKTDLYPAALVSQASSSDGGTLTVTGCTATGTISTDGKYAAGLVGIVQGAASISDCVSSVTINSSISGDGTHGGIVAVVTSSGTITGCLFNGKLITTATNSTNNCAGFIAWGNGTISNCLYAPATILEGETEVLTGDVTNYPSGTFYRGSAPSVSNCYYTRTLGTEQGKQAHSITAGDNVTVDFSGTATTYSVSGITAYTTGIKYNNVLYAGSGDAVSLTLSHADRPGYTFSGYEASAGTLSGTTLTMPDDDVEITANYTATTATIEMNAYGIMTYASEYDLDFTGISGLTAYVATSISDNTLTLTPVGKVPGGTGLLLKGTTSTTFTVLTTGSATTIDGNLMVGLTEATSVSKSTTDGYAYILANGEHGINWYLLEEASYTLKANSAYLRLSGDVAPNESRALTMVFEDEGTNIKEMVHGTSSNGTSNWYSLDGRKLDGNPTKKGVYINGGRRVVVK